MSDTLLFRGGSSASIDLATVQSREIVIDTDTDQIVSGPSKKKTVMEQSNGDVQVSGDLGVGTSIPVAELDVRGLIAITSSTSSWTPPNTNGISILGNVSTDNTSTKLITLLSDRSDRYASINSDRGSSSAQIGMSFCTSAGDLPEPRLTIRPDGDVLIGGTLPSAPNIQLKAAGDITTTGRVGIGTTGVQTALHVFSTNTITGSPSSSSANQIRFGNDDTTTLLGVSASAAHISAYDTANFSNTKNLVINQNGGNVGIGRSDPQAKLDVNGEIRTGAWDRSLTNVEGISINKYGRISCQKQADGVVFEGYKGNQVTSTISANGAATFVGNVLIGGTLPSAPNIKLKADGSAEFVGYVASSTSFISNRTLGGDYVLLGNLNGSRTSLITADGSAEFVGDVTCSDNSKGLVLKSPDGTSFRLSVANDGTLSASSI